MRAMHRGQYSTDSHATLGLIVSPQRGQLRQHEARSSIAIQDRFAGFKCHSWLADR
jgi:hypothetical protein